MKPGRELDALIAKEVFGAKVEFVNQKAGWRIDYRADKDECNNPIFTDYGCEGHRLKQYSTDIAAAWEVVEKLCRDSERHFVIEKTGAWLVRFRAGEFTPGETAPHAICLSALKAVGIELTNN